MNIGSQATTRPNYWGRIKISSFNYMDYEW